jgi:DNA-binding CsgD family transcriptional regulator
VSAILPRVGEREPARISSVRPDAEALGDVTAVLQRVHVPCWILDPYGVFTWVNDAFERVFGPLVGCHYSKFIAPESLTTADAHFGVAHDVDSAADIELELVRSDGSQVHTEISSVLLEKIGLCCGAFGLAAKPAAPRRRRAHSELTSRQADVLLLLAGGASTEQIANELYLSKTTVRNHIAHILTALGVHSRLAAVAKARREGLVDD